MCKKDDELVVSTHLKNISQILESSPMFGGENKKYLSCHHQDGSHENQPFKKMRFRIGKPIIFRCCHHPAAPRRGTAGVFSPVQSLLRTTARAIAANASKGPGAKNKSRFPMMEARMEPRDVDVFKKKIESK